MKRFLGVLLSGVIFFSAIGNGYGYWIWTPKTGRWLNPKYSVKPTPKEQLKFALELYKQAKYKDAIGELRKLLKYYPKSFEASEAQFHIGLCLEAQGELYPAFEAYQKVIDKYPFSSRIDEAVEHELKIGKGFFSGEKRKALGVELPVENPAIEIFRKVVDNSTYGKYAPEAQYLLGMSLKNAQRYQEARDELDKVASTYPDSERVASAKFEAADCATKIIPKPDYDQELTKEAKEKFEELVESSAAPELKKKAQTQLDSMKEKEAQGNLRIAEFYEKQKKYEAARIYYQEIVASCSYCSSATKARERLKELEKK